MGGSQLRSPPALPQARPPAREGRKKGRKRLQRGGLALVSSLRLSTGRATSLRLPHPHPDLGSQPRTAFVSRGQSRAGEAPRRGACVVEKRRLAGSFSLQGCRARPRMGGWRKPRGSQGCAAAGDAAPPRRQLPACLGARWPSSWLRVGVTSRKAFITPWCH